MRACLRCSTEHPYIRCPECGSRAIELTEWRATDCLPREEWVLMLLRNGKRSILLLERDAPVPDYVIGWLPLPELPEAPRG